MALDERSRHDLHRSAARALGDGEADTLISLLPPVGWADVATKADLDHLGESLRAEMRVQGAELRREFSTELERGLRRQTQYTIGTLVALQGVLLAALKLFS